MYVYWEPQDSPYSCSGCEPGPRLMPIFPCVGYVFAEVEASELSPQGPPRGRDLTWYVSTALSSQGLWHLHQLYHATCLLSEQRSSIPLHRTSDVRCYERPGYSVYLSNLEWCCYHYYHLVQHCIFLPSSL